jgi:flagellar basal-body rod protein FlgC
MQAMEISLTGLDVEWRRLELIAANLASANTPRIAGDPLGQARHLLTGPRTDFASHLNQVGGIDIESLRGVAIRGVQQDKNSPRLVHEPGNPNANSAGYVEYPSIDYAREMVQMVKTSRAYEANIVAMNTARQMYSKALDLGRRT